MRLRHDSFHIAGWLRAHELLGCKCSPAMIATSAKPTSERTSDETGHIAHDPEFSSQEPAQIGDVWELHNRNGSIVGYALTCPRSECDQGVHGWDHARNCLDRTKPDAAGCWTWSGSIEDDTLTATPSLHVVKEWGGCGYHGFLQNGVLTAG